MEELRCAGDSEQRLENAFESYSDTVLRIALSQTKNKTYADDILGEVFLRLVKNIGRLKSDEHVKAWLIRVTINCSHTYMKKLCRENTPLTQDIPAFASPESDAVYNAVMSLSLKYRTAVHLFYYEDMSVKAVSAAMKQSESATKMQLKRAREQLKTLLGELFF